MSLAFLLAVWGLGVAVSLAATGFVAAAGLGDVPGDRSSHRRITPTAGGLGVLAGMGAALAVAAPVTDGGWLAALASLVFALGVVGLHDDVFGLRARTKFALILVVAVGAVAVAGPVTTLPTVGDDIALAPWLGFAGSVLWVFVVVNTVNFMDGINGLAGASVNAVALVLAAIAASLGVFEAVWLALALSAGLVGFLPYNYAERARVFAGDVGALPMGLVVAVMGLLVAGEPTGRGVELVYIAPLLLLPMLADVFMTLVRRARRGEPLMEAHRDHLYQRLAQRSSHVSVSSLWVMSVVPLAVVAFAAIAADLSGSLVGLLAFAVLAAAIHTLASRALERRGL